MSKLEAVIQAQNRMNATACAIAGLAVDTGGHLSWVPPKQAERFRALAANFREDRKAFNTAMKAAQTRETT